MKTFYDKILKMLKLLPALIFFMLALSYSASAQKAVPNPVCYGAPINLQCSTLPGCGVTGSTYTWTDNAGWYAYTKDVTINFGSAGYGAAKYYLSVQYPPNGLSSGVVTMGYLDPININGTVTQPVCHGDHNGAITITVDGGSAFYISYNWSNGMTTQNISGLSAGTYTVTVTDDANCSQASSPFTITDPAGMTITKTGGSNVSCNGGNNGTLSINVAGGTTAYSYAWSPSGPNSPTLTGLTAGNYAVTVTDGNGCKATGSWGVTQPGALTIDSFKKDATCNGYSNGYINLTVSGGTSPYAYTWSNGGGNVRSISNLSTGNYTVTVQDANSCLKTGSWHIGESSALSLSPTVNQPKCVGNTGSITVTMTGGTSPYNYTWSNGHNASGPSDGITGLTPGSYTVTVTDANSCTTNNSWTINAPVAMTISTVTQTDPRCATSNDGVITIGVTGGVSPYAYAWSSPPGGTTNTISGLGGGTYTVTVTDNNSCTKTATYLLTAPSALTINNAVTHVNCNGELNGKIDLTVNGGTSPYSYNWAGVTGAQRYTAHVTGLVSGTYSVTVSDAHTCVATGSYSITEPTALSGNGVVTNPKCFGGSDGTATISGFGGTSPYTYAWQTGSNAQLITGLSAGTYYVTITDAHSCINWTWQTITAPPDMTINGTPKTVTCYGGIDGQITTTVTGGTSGYTYLWNNAQTNSTATGLSAGTYTVTVKDANSCTKTQTFSVTSNPQIVIDLVTKKDPNCNGGSDGYITVSASGGVSPYSYSWTGSRSGASITGLPTGTYTVTVTDAGSCTKTASYSITAPDALSINGAVTDVKCNGELNGKVDLTVTGGTTAYSYFWVGVTGAQRYTAHVTGLASGTYSVTVTDAHTCTATASYHVSEPVALSGNGIVTNPKCFGGSDGTATISGFGGTSPYTYAWQTGSNAQLITGLSAGTYYVTITDAHSCINWTWQTITAPPDITITGTPKTITCNGGNDGAITTTVSGGTPCVADGPGLSGYQYSWNTGAHTSGVSGLTAGTYTVTVMDCNSCTKTQTFEVTANPALSITLVTKTDPSCNQSSDGVITVSASGGLSPYSYAWTGGRSGATITGLPTGTYTVTVTDQGSCQKTDSWSITAPPALSITDVITNVKCNGELNGKIDLTVTGGTTAYSYFWVGVTGTQRYTPHVAGLASGTYSVTVTDAHQCKAFGSYQITEPTALSGNGVVTNPKCFGGSDGTATITGFGGTSPYYYTWATGSHDQLITGLSAGTYYVTITDAQSCVNWTWQTITAPPDITITGTPKIITCHGGNDGAITTTVTGGTPCVPDGPIFAPYHYAWNTGSHSSSISGLTAGTYTVTVSDCNSCTKTQTFEVTANPALSITLVSKNDPLCNQSSDGSITVSASGGLSPYSYAWTGSRTGATITGLPTGTYTVTVTDQGSCQLTDSYTITAPPALSITDVISHVKCNGELNGKIDLTVNGGTTAYSYFWVGVTGAQRYTPHVAGLVAGTYSVTVTDAHQCKAFGSYQITEPTALSGNGVVTNPKCFGGSDGTATITGFGGTAPYYYTWATGSHEQLITGLSAGTYYVTITDAQSCINWTWQTITAPPDITISGTPVTVTCKGGSDGKLTITATGGTPGYTYDWSNGGTTETITGLTAGNYTVTVTDANSCNKTGTFYVDENPAITITLVGKSDPKCFQSCDGTITVSAAGGLPPYYYNWTSPPGGSEATVTGLCTGTYTVTVTDQGSCYATAEYSVTAPPPVTVQLIKTDLTCYGYHNGVITASAGGGTPDYTYLWNNGETTPTITGLTAGVYSVTVTDAQSCQVSDQVEILEPPAWWVDIWGPHHACCTSPQLAHYHASVDGDEGWLGWYNNPNCPVVGDKFDGEYPFPCPCRVCDLTYQWVVTGGTITSGWNTPNITVDWACCTQGTVTVTVTKCDGCMVTETINVAVSLPPAPVITGPASVYANQPTNLPEPNGTTYCTPDYPGHLFTWTVVGGTVVAGQGTHCITVQWGPYPPCGCGQVSVCESDTVIGCNQCTYAGCTGCATMNITILPDGQNLEGTVYYKNEYNTALNGVTVKLRDPSTNTIIATTTSGPNLNPPLYTGDPGYFAFTNIPDGNYQLEASYNGEFGGNNATDALLVQLYTVNPVLYPLTGLNLTVADVNASLTYTGLDALYIKLRTVGAINSYPAGDWKFDNPNVSVSPVPTTQDIYGLCVGDVNGSYIPSTGYKEASFLSAIEDGTQTIPVNESFTYNIRSNSAAELGAMTLFMKYDQSRFDLEGVNSSLEGMKYVIDEGKIALAWSDTKSLGLKNNDPVISLKMSAKEPVSKPTQIFTLLPGSEFADKQANRLQNFDLKFANVITPNGVNEFSAFNYPNPFKNTTNIVYTLPESGKVRLVLTNMYGKTLRVLVDEMQNAGSYTVTVNPFDYNLTPGVYLYKIEVTGATDSYVKVNKMLFTR